MCLLFLFPAAQHKMNVCPGTQQVLAEAAELLNLFTVVSRKKEKDVAEGCDLPLW